MMHSDLERVLFHESTILARLDEIAGEITRRYEGRDLTVVSVLNGSLIFMADLLRRIPLPLKLDCVQASSYHGGTRSSGEVAIPDDWKPDFDGREILILDDILDSGRTLSALRERIRQIARPADVAVCVLLSKRRERERHVDADYVAFEIDDEFVVGYGLDFEEKYRNLPLIGVLKPSISHPGIR